MPWFKVDDRLYSHPKWTGLSPAARGLWVSAGSWCAGQLTDGHVPRRALCIFGGRPRFAAELVSAGLWDVHEDGWVFRNWSEFQPSRAQVEENREIARRRQAMNSDPALRKAIRGRDGDLCRYCGRRVNWTDRRGPNGGTYDHVRPISRGGDESIDNLVVACRRCNTEKGPRTPDEAGMRLRPVQENLGDTQVDTRQPVPSRPVLTTTHVSTPPPQADPEPDDELKKEAHRRTMAVARAGRLQGTFAAYERVVLAELVKTGWKPEPPSPSSALPDADAVRAAHAVPDALVAAPPKRQGLKMEAG